MMLHNSNAAIKTNVILITSLVSIAVSMVLYNNILLLVITQLTQFLLKKIILNQKCVKFWRVQTLITKWNEIGLSICTKILNNFETRHFNVPIYFEAVLLVNRLMSLIIFELIKLAVIFLSLFRRINKITLCFIYGFQFKYCVGNCYTYKFRSYFITRAF